jgi:hypothetical protein
MSQLNKQIIEYTSVHGYNNFHTIVNVDFGFTYHNYYLQNLRMLKYIYWLASMS